MYIHAREGWQSCIDRAIILYFALLGILFIPLYYYYYYYSLISYSKGLFPFFYLYFYSPSSNMNRSLTIRTIASVIHAKRCFIDRV